MNDISVLTLGRGRAAHLANLIIGLNAQRHPPRELVVGVMQAAPYDDLPTSPFPVRQVIIPGNGLLLARARNTVASLAEGANLLFLDIDCIPGPDLCGEYGTALAAFDGCLMGEVMYLPSGANRPGWSFEAFEAVCERHSDRSAPPDKGIERCLDYRCFWSLNFALRRETFLQSPRFDERYVGYGGEDTDFGKALTMSGHPLAWMKGGRSYHQYHPHHMPPVHHLESVIRNAELFEQKWGYRTMGHWLHAFMLMGLIDDTPGRPIKILRPPTPADFDFTFQQSHRPYANTASVIRALNEQFPSGAAPVRRNLDGISA